MALNVAQLLQVGTASTTGAVQVGAGLSVDANGLLTLASGQPFPGTFINIPTTIPSSVPTTWQSPSNVIFATGCIELSKDNVTFTQDPISIDFDELLYVRWNSGPSCSGAPHGTTITGTITDGNYVESASFTINRIPNAFTLDDLSSQGLSATITSNPSFLTGLNVPAYVTVVPGATLSNVQASIGATAFVGIPTTGTTLIINPNQSIQLRGDTGASNNTTYSASIQVGDSFAGVTTDTWDVTTVSVAAAIAQPSITAPPNGATGLNPASSTPAGITLTASSYTPLNGAGAQTSSEWEVYEAIQQQPETSAITNVTTVSGAWTGYPSANDSYSWFRSAWSPSLSRFAAIGHAGGGVGNVSMYSSNGTSWTSGTVPSSGSSGDRDICWSPERNLFVAVGGGGSLFTSPNGISWTLRLKPRSGSTWGVTWANSLGLFVAVGDDVGVINSSDGITWTEPNPNVGLRSLSVGWSEELGILVALGYQSSANPALYSTDGINWLGGTGMSGGYWEAVTWSSELGLFAAVSSQGTGRVRTSSDGINWTTPTSTVDGESWKDITWSSERHLFVACAYDKVMTSSDGVTWTLSNVDTSGFNWKGVSWAPSLGTFALTGSDGTNRVALSSGGGVSSAELELTDTTDLALMSAGDSVVEIGGGGDASGTISLIDSASVPPKLTLSPYSGTWNVGATVQDTTAPIYIPSAPTTTPPDPTKYTPITGSPFTDTSAPFNTLLIPQSSLETSSTYYSRVQYATTNSQAATSPFSAWSSFRTASSFLIPPGTAMDGGYFGGQINDGGIIYNLIVAPAATGQDTSGLTWGPSSAYSNPTLAQNEVYGFPMSQAGNSATYPALQFARGLSIGGYNDWYLPAKNELEVLYYFLKPSTPSNTTSSGNNPNAVAPEPVSTNYTATNPLPTSADGTGGTGDFLDPGSEQFFPGGNGYWTSTEYSTGTTFAWRQSFTNGAQSGGGKGSTGYVRAIRREYANAPVAIGDAFGGGFFAGQYVDGGTTYNLIVAPKATGETSSLAYRSPAAADANPPSQDTVYGGTTTTTLSDANHPIFQWATGLTIATFSDWYVPAINELAIICNNLGPNWTTAGDFTTGGTEALAGLLAYWSSTEDPSSTNSAFAQYPGNNTQSPFSKVNTAPRVRAVRRVPA